MNARILSRTPWLGLVLLLWACSEGPEGPLPLEGTYSAVSANDRGLPTFINPDGSTGAGRQLTEAALVLSAPDSLRVTVTTRVVDAGGDPGAAVTDTLYATYRAEGSQLLLSPRGTRPLRLDEEGSVLRSGGAVVLTLRVPLPPSQGLGTYPVEVLFSR